MIKKAGFIILLSLIILSTTITFVKSQDIQDSLRDLEDTKNQVENKLTDKEVTEEYLGQKWTEVIDEKMPWLYKANPVFKFLFGHEFELSWSFLAAFLLWAIIYALFYPMVKLLMGGIFQSIGVTVAISAITTNLTVPKYIAFLSTLVKNFTHSIIAIFSLIILVFLAFYLSSQISRTIRKKAFQKKIERATEFGEAVEKANASAEAMVEGYKEGAD